MGKDRVIYEDWIVELGYDPVLGPPTQNEQFGGYNNEIILAVNRVLDSLEPDESLFIRRFYFQGMGYREISSLTGRAIYRLEKLHLGIIRKLRTRLPQILDIPGLPPRPINPDCPLCNHPRIDQINQLLGTKTKEETWRRIIKILGKTYGLTIKSPQRLIGHQKYHLI